MEFVDVVDMVRMRKPNPELLKRMGNWTYLSLFLKDPENCTIGGLLDMLHLELINQKRPDIVYRLFTRIQTVRQDAEWTALKKSFSL